MSARGHIWNVKRKQQIHNFEDLKIGNITPTDVDLLIEYRGQAFVLGELKYLDAPLGDGQKWALERMVDVIGKCMDACLIVAEHSEHDPASTVNAAECVVRAWYWRGEWRDPSLPGTTLKQAIFAFLRVPETDRIAVARVRQDSDRVGPQINTDEIGDRLGELIAPHESQINWG
jgi:hypothetical protein